MSWELARGSWTITVHWASWTSWTSWALEMGVAAQLDELDALDALGAGTAAGAAGGAPQVEVLTPKVVDRVRAAVAAGAGKKALAAAIKVEIRILLSLAIPLELTDGGSDIVAFEDAFVSREPRVLHLELAFPADYPEAAAVRVVSASSDSFRTGGNGAQEFRLLLEGYLDVFVGSPCCAAAIAFAVDNAAPLFEPLYCSCFLDIAIDGDSVGRLVLELSTRLTPMAAGQLCI